MLNLKDEGKDLALHLRVGSLSPVMRELMRLREERPKRQTQISSNKGLESQEETGMKHHHVCL